MWPVVTSMLNSSAKHTERQAKELGRSSGSSTVGPSTLSAHLSPCQRFVCLTLLWHRTLALLSHSGLPAGSKACSAFRLAQCLHWFHSRTATPQVIHTAVWTSAIFSCERHKEWHFLLPLVTAIHLFAAWFLSPLTK